MALNELYAKNLERTKKLLEESLTEDIDLVNAFRAYTRICESCEAISKAVNDWSAWYFPTEKINITDLHDKKHNKKSFDSVKETAKIINDLTENKKKIEQKIFERFRQMCPNTNAISGELQGLRLMEKTGSLKKLAECTASKIQVLGAEKALFRHITKGTKPPKYGILFHHQLVSECSEEHKGKMASAVANKISIAVKIDFFKGEYIGNKLADELKKTFEKYKKPAEKKERLKKIEETKFPNIYRKGNTLYTKNLLTEEYREWHTTSSKLATAIIKGVKATGLGKGSIVLYLGASSGNTASHVSDIIGKEGFVFAVEISPVSMRDLIKICEERKNTAPILADAGQPELYKEMIEQTDAIYQDVSQKNQVEIFKKNVDLFLKPTGTGILCVKARSIDSKRKAKEIFDEVEEELKKKYMILDRVLLEPYQKEHCMFIIKKNI